MTWGKPRKKNWRPFSGEKIERLPPGKKTFVKEKKSERHSQGKKMISLPRDH